MTKHNENPKEFRVYIGTYTSGKSEGIYIYRLNLASGALKFQSVVKGLKNPSFLDLTPQGDYLYAVNEVGDFGGKPSGAVSAFSVDPKSGDLTFLNQQSTVGSGPCHVSLDKSGKLALVANYGGGSIAALPIQADGSLGEASDFVQHQGSSLKPGRQKEPHAHMIITSPDNRYVLATDLGLDKILVYQLDLKNGKLKPNTEPWAQVKAGAGPRHFDFHPSGRYVYLINELDSTMIAFTYDETHGVLKEIQTVPTIPEGFTGTNYCADIHVSPSGKFVYGSNRGHDSLVIYAIDPNTGKLSYVGHEPTQGKTPRNFAIDPTETFLLAANQGSDNIVTFKVDQQTGKLISTGQIAEVPKAVCMKII